MYKLKKTAIICLLLAVVLLMPVSASASSPGSAGDPLVSQSWVEEYLDSQFAPLEQQIKDLRSALLTYLGMGPVDLQLYVGSPTAYVNGVAKSIDPDRSSIVPQLLSDSAGGGYTMVPIRFVAESIGAEVEWVDASKQVIFTEGQRKVALTIGSKQAVINNTTYTMGYAPYISNGRTFVHIRFVAEAFSCAVDWDQQQKRVDIQR